MKKFNRYYHKRKEEIWRSRKSKRNQANVWKFPANLFLEEIMTREYQDYFKQQLQKRKRFNKRRLWPIKANNIFSAVGSVYSLQNV